MQCVKPIGGFGPNEELVTCQNPAAYQSRRNAGLVWCAEHVEADTWVPRDWVPIDAPEAVAAREEHARLLAEIKTKREATVTWAAEHPKLMELAQAVYDHAEAYYSDGGWDVIYECWEISQIAQELEKEDPVPSTVEAAVAAFEPVVSVWADRQADAVNSAF